MLGIKLGLSIDLEDLEDRSNYHVSRLWKKQRAKISKVQRKVANQIKDKIGKIK